MTSPTATTTAMTIGNASCMPPFSLTPTSGTSSRRARHQASDLASQGRDRGEIGLGRVAPGPGPDLQLADHAEHDVNDHVNLDSRSIGPGRLDQEVVVAPRRLAF